MSHGAKRMVTTGNCTWSKINSKNFSACILSSSSVRQCTLKWLQQLEQQCVTLELPTCILNGCTCSQLPALLSCQVCEGQQNCACSLFLALFTVTRAAQQDPADGPSAPLAEADCCSSLLFKLPSSSGNLCPSKSGIGAQPKRGTTVGKFRNGLRCAPVRSNCGLVQMMNKRKAIHR